MSTSERPKKALYGVPEGAEIIGMDEKTLRQAVETGQIPGMRIGRVYKIPHWWIDQQLNGPRAAA
jgi:hypothetical protein